MGFFNWVLRTLEKLGEKIITLGGGLSGKIKVAALRIKNKRSEKSSGVYYVNGTEILPPPLTREEESEIISRLGAEDSARQVLIEHNLRLVVYIAKRFENTGAGIEDLVSIGTIGLIKFPRLFLTLRRNLAAFI